MTEEQKKIKGTASNIIAWIFITLQIMLIIGGSYGTNSQYRGTNVSFHNAPAIVQSVGYLFGVNLLGIGALFLSLIVWLQHKNLKGKTTTIVAAIIIIVNSLVLS